MKNRFSAFLLLFVAFAQALALPLAPQERGRRVTTRPRTAAMRYEAVTHREVIPEPTLPTLGAANTSITDPVFGTRILRITDSSGSTTRFHTSSAAEHPTWSKNSTHFYILDRGNSTLLYSFDKAAFSRASVRTVLLSNEPVFSKEDNDKMYGVDAGGGNDSHTISSHSVSGNSYSAIKDLDELGFNLSTDSTNRNGGFVGYVSNSFAAPTERIMALFGGSGGDYHRYVTVMDASGNVSKVLDSHTVTVGSSFNNDVAKTGTVSITSGGSSVTGSGTNFDPEINVGNWVTINGETKKVTARASDTSLTVSGTWGSTASGVAIAVRGYTMSANATTAFNGTPTGTAAINGTTTVTGTGTDFLAANTGSGLIPGQRITINGETRTIASIESATSLTVTSAFSTTASGQTIASVGCRLHGAFISLDGRYVFLTNALTTHKDPSGLYQVIWDTSTDTITKVTYKGDGHAMAGFEEYYNQSFTSDSLAWYARPFNDVNTSGSVRLLNTQRCTSGCDQFDADHSSFNNAAPTERRPPFLSGVYGFNANAGPPSARARDAYDDELLAVQTKIHAAETATIYRLAHHRSDIRSEVLSTISDGGDGLTASQNTITLASAANFATSGNIQIELSNSGSLEYASYTGKSGNQLTGVTRGISNTSGATHAEGAHVTQPGAVYFWYSPRPQISPCGRYAIFTSNWEKTLGLVDVAETGGNYRVDAFLVELPVDAPSVSNASNLSVGSITNTTAEVAFDGSQLGDSVVEYSTDLSFGSASREYVQRTTGHSVTLSGLVAGTLYNVRVSSRNRAGVTGTTATTSFTTTGSPPSDFLSATFTVGSDTALASYTSETGGGWNIGSGQSAGMTVDASGDRVYHTAATNYYSSATPPSADYYVEGVVFVATNNVATSVFGITGRHQTDSNSMYGIRYNVDSGKWQMYRRLSGSFAELDFLNATLTNGQSYTIRITFSGSNISWSVEGADQGTTVDANITGAGRPGIAGAGAASTSTTGLHLTSITAR